MPSKEVSLATFPSNKFEALAMLWLQNQDLSDKSPEEVRKLYDEAVVRTRKKKKD